MLLVYNNCMIIQNIKSQYTIQTEMNANNMHVVKVGQYLDERDRAGSIKFFKHSAKTHKKVSLNFKLR